MKAWIYVEGRSDELGLGELWREWRQRISTNRHGIAVIPLSDKSQFLKKFGARAAQKLVDSTSDVVVGLPDLHPVAPYVGTKYQHHNLAELKTVQQKAVKEALTNIFGVRPNDIERHLTRLRPSAFKHDFEMLLLAAEDELRATLGTNDLLSNRWKTPVEDQNLDRPPKRIIEDLFLRKSKRRRSYVETKDAPAVLRRVRDVAAILKTPSGQCTCPEFVDTLRWLGEHLGEPCCNLD